MKMKLIAKESFFLLLTTLMLASAGFAQEFRGTITGNVVDPNGASIPGAKVVVKNTATNISTTVNTNDEGVYIFPALIPGTYTVSATANGFKTSSCENLAITVDGRLTVDFKLEVGST